MSYKKILLGTAGAVLAAFAARGVYNALTAEDYIPTEADIRGASRVTDDPKGTGTFRNWLSKLSGTE